MKAMRIAKKHFESDARICFTILVRFVCPMLEAVLSAMPQTFYSNSHYISMRQNCNSCIIFAA